MKQWIAWLGVFCVLTLSFLPAEPAGAGGDQRALLAPSHGLLCVSVEAGSLLLLGGGGGPHRIATDLPPGPVAWSPDGASIAVVDPRLSPAGDLRLVIVDPESGRARQLRVDRSAGELDLWTRVDGVRWPAPSRLVVEGSLDPSTGQVAVVDPLDGAVNAVYSGRFFAWSPHGTHLAAVGWVPHFAPSSEKLRDRLELDGEVVYPPTLGVSPLHLQPPLIWSPSGADVAFVEQRGESWGLVAVAIDGRPLVATPVPRGSELRGWSDDGEALLLDDQAGGSAFLVEVDSGVVRTATSEVLAKRFSGLTTERRRRRTEQELGSTAACR